MVVGIRMDVFHCLVNTLIQPLPLTLETQVDAWCLFSLQTEQMHTEKLYLSTFKAGLVLRSLCYDLQPF